MSHFNESLNKKPTEKQLEISEVYKTAFHLPKSSRRVPQSNTANIFKT